MIAQMDDSLGIEKRPVEFRENVQWRRLRGIYELAPGDPASQIRNHEIAGQIARVHHDHDMPGSHPLVQLRWRLRRLAKDTSQTAIGRGPINRLTCGIEPTDIW